MLLGALLSAGVVLAQTPQQSEPQSNTPATQTDHPRMHHAPNPDRMAAHLQKKLNLSEDQVNQIKPVLQDRAQQLSALRSDTSLSQQDRRAKARDIMKDTNTKIEAVLNDTQKQQFEQMRQQHHGHHKGQGSQAPTS
jgi:hypothetical protein